VGLGRSLLSLNSSTRDDAAARMKNNRRAIALIEEASRTQPLTSAARLVEAQGWFGAAEVELEAKRIAESLDARNRSIALLKESLSRDPDNPETARWLGTAEKRLAYTHITQTHDFGKAVAALGVAMQIDRQRLARDPGNAVIKLDLALGQAYVAGLLHRRGDLEGALAMHQSVNALRGEILQADPRNVRVRYLLITDQARMGSVLRDLGRTADARAAFDRGFKLLREGDPVAMQSADMQSAEADLRKESAAPARLAGKTSQRQR
jgi:tetratricopeptide (TPR) repeat protein